jgi:hypothetical protein
MLIETPAKLNDVISVKMVGGDEVLGRLHDERTDDYVELNKPMLVMMAQQGFGLVPYMLTAGPDAKIKVDRRHVVAFTKTYDDVAKEYLKQTTGLIT